MRLGTPSVRVAKMGMRRAAGAVAFCALGAFGAGCGGAAPVGAVGVAEAVEPAAKSAEPPRTEGQADAVSLAGTASSAPAPAANPGPAPLPAAEDAKPASAPALGEAKIRMEGGDGLMFVPLVDAVLSGQPTSMLVDTGASHHVLSAWFANEASLPVAYAGDKAKDHAGKGAGKVGRVEQLKVRIAGWEARDWPITLVLSLPDALKNAGIGGVLAPHRAARPGFAVVLDLKAGRMREEPEQAALSQVRPGKIAFSGVRVCGGKTPGEGSLLAVEAVIEGQPVWLKLDTGATQSSVFSTSKAALALFSKLKGNSFATGAAGKISAKVAPGIALKVGQFERIIDINVEEGKDKGACEGDGYLGLDVLSACVLVLAGEKSAGYCEAPPNLNVPKTGE